MKLFFKSEEEIKICSDKQRWREFVAIVLTCKECYKNFFREKENNNGQKLKSTEEEHRDGISEGKNRSFYSFYS